jgi:beta-glucuronidase
VFHSAVVWVNGQQIGSHLRKGYTSFAFDISAVALPGQANTITVKVDNSFDQNMLPRGNSYDWTADGGIIRPVSLLVTPKTFIDLGRRCAAPFLFDYLRGSQNRGERRRLLFQWWARLADGGRTHGGQ